MNLCTYYLIDRCLVQVNYKSCKSRSDVKIHNEELPNLRVCMSIYVWHLSDIVLKCARYVTIYTHDNSGETNNSVLYLSKFGQYRTQTIY